MTPFLFRSRLWNTSSSVDAVRSIPHTFNTTQAIVAWFPILRSWRTHSESPALSGGPDMPDTEGPIASGTMEKRMGGHIRVRGVSGATQGQQWDSPELLRVGRLESLEVRIED